MIYEIVEESWSFGGKRREFSIIDGVLIARTEKRIDILNDYWEND